MEMNYSKKISIVIPTRNRAEYLGPCVRTCLMSNDKNLEVVVSNNFSVDDTEKVIRSIKDPRLKYVATDRDLSMRQNFEFALSHASGDYVIIIGDDDGVLANGLTTLRRLLNKYDPDVLLWRHITYLWPHKYEEPYDGLLKFRYRDFCGPIKKLDPKKILEGFCKGEIINYRDGANIYHGCISRRVINQIATRGGVYFQGQVPDVNTAISNLAHAQSLIWVRNPITIAGQGEKSNGAAMNASAAKRNEQQKIEQNFLELGVADPVEPEMNFQIRAISASTYANLLNVNRVHMNGTLEVDHEKWREIIINDMKRFPLEHRRWDLLDDFFCQKDPNYRSDSALLNLDQGVISTVDGSSGHKPKKYNSKKYGVGPEHLKTVETVARWLDRVTSPAYFPCEINMLAKVKQLFRMIGMMKNRAMLG
ncbi:MAG: glycosyltransferase family 2 protein [Sneathiella sp.]|nr:glycosyltransferase family 2 protein [Sneathiella sp.]